MAIGLDFPISFFSNRLVPLSGSIRLSIKKNNIYDRHTVKNILCFKQYYITKKNGSIKK